MLGASFVALAAAVVRLRIRRAGGALVVALCGGGLVKLLRSLRSAVVVADGGLGGGGSRWPCSNPLATCTAFWRKSHATNLVMVHD